MGQIDLGKQPDKEASLKSSEDFLYLFSWLLSESASDLGLVQEMLWQQKRLKLRSNICGCQINLAIERASASDYFGGFHLKTLIID